MFSIKKKKNRLLIWTSGHTGKPSTQCLFKKFLHKCSKRKDIKAGESGIVVNQSTAAAVHPVLKGVLNNKVDGNLLLEVHFSSFLNYYVK